MTFFTHKQNLPSEKQLIGGTMYKIRMICRFRCAVTMFCCERD